MSEEREPGRAYRVATFADGTILGWVHGCEFCHRWTRCHALSAPRRYPYHRRMCEGAWEELPARLAHLDPYADRPGHGGDLLQLLDEDTPLDWQPAALLPLDRAGDGPGRVAL